MAVSPYIGRFAPSPTGPLHKGSLLAALASFLDARANSGQWLLRIEDIDPPREVPGAADRILRQLDDHGLHWDGPVLYQSSRLVAYQNALHQLGNAGLLYACYCNRARLRTLGGCYDGACRANKINSGTTTPDKPHATRIQIPEHSSISLNDLIQGPLVFDLSKAGDFILRRRDQLPAYQLACSLDDGFQNISHVIRGSDLLDSTPRQIHLLHCLGLQVPHYGHIPVLSNAQGQKLSKQNHAPELSSSKASSNLFDCLHLLAMPAPQELKHSSVPQVIKWAIEHWQLNKVPALTMVAKSDKTSDMS
ncbi:MAG: tRNA glutamyl-Q(34) synthetase GluQRS [Gammaproteobacteria bacterium]|nr:MAG: tRNA glutamyl-Q(34) synthetase GluQRS [Gammaproteobacteria bacterium]